MNVGELFPGAMCEPIAVRDAFERIENKIFGNDVKGKALNILKQCKQGQEFPDIIGKRIFFSFIRLDFDKPSNVIPKSTALGGYCYLFHPIENRGITLEEIKRLHSFSDSFIFTDFQNSQNCIGNSVPPLFLRAIALQIKYKLFVGDPLTTYPKSMTYPEILESAWQDHLAPCVSDAPTVVSLFAGGGGSSLGYSMAGYKELLAVEWDNNAVETFKLNFSDVPVYHGDIAKLSVEECMNLAGLSRSGELDLLDGSPPCQGVSTAGKRLLDDPRNQLFREYVRLLRGLKPKVFVMENVSGLVKGKMKLIFAEIMRELKASGYQVKCRLMNAMYFYVPQSRERLIFIGTRGDLEMEPRYPKVESEPIKIRDALLNCNAKTFTGDRVEKNIVYRSATTKRSQNQPFGTLTNRMNRHGIHYSENRYFSIEEIKRGGSYPDTFILTGTLTDRTCCIGNSVPPLMMKVIATFIKNELLSKT